MSESRDAALPDFELAPWEGADPKRVVPTEGDAGLSGLILGLAVAFNDFKDVIYASSRLTAADSGPKPISPEVAQLAGMKSHVLRWQCGLLHELMKLLRFNKAAIESRPFQELLGSMPAPALEAWNAVRGVALETTQDKTTTAALLERLRNQVSFHYMVHPLVKGYRHHFFGGPLSDLNRQAVFSDGDSMEGTRFYFADAASQACLTTEVADAVASMDDLLKRVASLSNDVNVALKHVVVSYIRKVDPSSARFSIEGV